ncbi:MAG: aminodeoxychorismate/anthranilate synthase component II [Candidatus Hadarchaeales archaeon]
MRIVVIDNIDSFVYNLVHYVGELGAEPVVFTKDANLMEIERAKPDGIIISPGPGRPENAGVSVTVVKKFAGRVPILGVCLGHQVIGHVFGAKIVQAKRLMHGKTSKIRYRHCEIFKGLPNPFEATRYHSLAIDASTLPEELELIAWTDDSEKEVMAVKHIEFPVFGVQFHPESILTKDGKKIIKNFLEVVR